MPTKTVKSLIHPPGTDVEAYLLTSGVERARIHNRIPTSPTAAASGEIGADGTVSITANTGTYVLRGRTDEVQTITVDATGGTFTVTYAGQTTIANAFNIAAATLQTNLENLSNLVPGDVEVTKSGSVYTITFRGVAGLGGTNVAAVTTNAASLTGNTQTATVATVTQGAKADDSGTERYLVFRIGAGTADDPT